MNLPYVLLCCLGLTYILKYGSILRWLRNPLCRIGFFKELFKCSLCLGFWSGVILGIPCHLLTADIHFILLPLASSAVSWLFDGLIRLIQTKEMLMDKELGES